MQGSHLMSSPLDAVLRCPQPQENPGKRLPEHGCRQMEAPAVAALAAAGQVNPAHSIRRHLSCCSTVGTLRTTLYNPGNRLFKCIENFLVLVIVNVVVFESSEGRAPAEEWEGVLAAARRLPAAARQHPVRRRQPQRYRAAQGGRT